MKIENNYSQPFRAKFIDTVKNIKTLEHSSIVKIDVQNDADIKALENVAKYWRGAKYVTNIHYAATEMKHNSKYFQYNEIYALISQKSDYKNLNDGEILGLVHINQADAKTAIIERIEADPEIINAIHRKIKGIGTAMIDYLKTIYDTIICSPAASKTVKNFYIKNGFKESMILSNLFFWKK